ncbi:MAG: 6-phospho-3-hexuloisomerase [Promethearchaeota archaeon CR_4]|nr:MAG: 6-phospho-3-hexuloisomerase [Candidatus Lokiarchaeota archaeon CR_4]
MRGKPKITLDDKEEIMSAIEIRILDTLAEISGQVKKVRDSLNLKPVSDLLEKIIAIQKAGQMVFLYGAGRSGFICRCFAQRLMHIGVKSCFISDTVTPAFTAKDLLIVMSGSGETTSPMALAAKAKKIGGTLACLTSNPASSIGKLADIVVVVKSKSKDVAMTEVSLAPYTSLFDISCLALFDSLGGALMVKLGQTEKDIDTRHATVE